LNFDLVSNFLFRISDLFKIRIMQIPITILSAMYVLFLPGLSLSFVFFRWGKIDVLERIALSFALSLAVVPLVVFYTNLVGIKITALSVILQTASIIVISLIIIGVQHLKRRRHENVES